MLRRANIYEYVQQQCSIVLVRNRQHLLSHVRCVASSLYPGTLYYLVFNMLGTVDHSGTPPGFCFGFPSVDACDVKRAIPVRMKQGAYFPFLLLLFVTFT